MPRLIKRQSKNIGEILVKLDASNLQEVIGELEAEVAAYKQDAERYIWLRDYSPQPNPDGEGRAEGYGDELDKLCDEGLEVLKASSDPTKTAPIMAEQDS